MQPIATPRRRTPGSPCTCQTAFVLQRQWVANAHNLVLQLLFAWGIVGTLFVAVPAAWVARFVVVEARRRQGLTVPFFCGATALLAQSMVDGTIYDAKRVEAPGG